MEPEPLPLQVARTLAERLERIAAEDMRRLVRAAASAYPACAPEALEVAGGVAAYVGPGSPVNQTMGAGLLGEVTQGDVEGIEHFFLGKGATPVVSACSLADASLERVLAARGWRQLEREDVMVRDLPVGERLPEPDPRIELCLAETPEERELWALVSANGFSAPDDPTPAELQLCRSAVARRDASFLTAFLDGGPAGTGELQIAGGVAWLSADSTLPQYRNRGVQRSLQLARLALAHDAGCDLAVSEAVPGGASARNMERLGFRYAYSRTEWVGSSA